MAKHLLRLATRFTALWLTSFLGAFVDGPPPGQGIPTPASVLDAHPKSGPEPATEGHAYHKEPPSETMPATLDPRQFSDNPTAFVSYSVAARIRKVLFQEPCYCGCDKTAGHDSLLNCFTTQHGRLCHVCQLEVLFCFQEHKKGRTVREIREAIAKGEAWKLNLNHYVEMYLSRYQPPRQP